jgi:hypothetical protein
VGKPINDGVIDIDLDDDGEINTVRRRKGSEAFDLEGEVDPSSDPQPQVSLKQKGADFPDYVGQLLYEVVAEGQKTMVIVGGVFRESARLKRTERTTGQDEDTWVAVKQGGG